jgi:hypothetical protein
LLHQDRHLDDQQRCEAGEGGLGEGQVKKTRRMMLLRGLDLRHENVRANLSPV